MHAENDWEIPVSHSETLFEAILSPYLPPPLLFSKTPTQEELEEIARQTAVRRERRDQLVQRTDIAAFGTLVEASSGGRRVALLKTLEGGHNRVGELEGVQEVIRNIFHLQ